ncbi:MAG TPA: protocatechuate 3,4-dioxygenase subunit alpha [Streptosporangiaceae bacterium]
MSARSVPGAITPSQTVGPFLGIGLPWPDGPFVVPEGTPGAITITGRVLDGAAAPVPDALIETWQAGPNGQFNHPDDPRRRPTARSTPGGGMADGGRGPGAGEQGTAFRGFGRCPTGPDGSYRIVTMKPGPLPCPDGGTEAPHLDVSVFARGLLDRVVTRIYFPDEVAANDADPVLSSLGDRARAATLIAQTDPDTPGELTFDIRLQGERETVFFDV